MNPDGLVKSQKAVTPACESRSDVLGTFYENINFDFVQEYHYSARGRNLSAAGLAGVAGFHIRYHFGDDGGESPPHGDVSLPEFDNTRIEAIPCFLFYACGEDDGNRFLKIIMTKGRRGLEKDNVPFIVILDERLFDSTPLEDYIDSGTRPKTIHPFTPRVRDTLGSFPIYHEEK